MLYTIPYLSPHYGYLDNVPYFGAGAGLILNNGGSISNAHFISTDMTLGATQIPDASFPYGINIRTSTVKASQGYRVVEYVKAFISFYRTLYPSYPSVPPNITLEHNSAIYILGGVLNLYRCTLGARAGGYWDLNPGGFATTGYILMDNAQLALAGCRIRGNEYLDFTNVITGNPRFYGFHAALLSLRGSCKLSLGGYEVTGTPGVNYSYNSDNNNIHFERTYYGADSRNGGANPGTAAAGINETDPWAAGENDTTRAARGPTLSTLIYIPEGGSLEYPSYTIWHSWGLTSETGRQGFKGKLGSPAASFTLLSQGATVKYQYQYVSSPVCEAGLDFANLANASTAVNWDATSVSSANKDTQSSLNMTTTRYKTGVLYKLGHTIATVASVVGGDSIKL